MTQILDRTKKLFMAYLKFILGIFICKFWQFLINRIVKRVTRFPF